MFPEELVVCFITYSYRWVVDVAAVFPWRGAHCCTETHGAFGDALADCFVEPYEGACADEEDVICVDIVRVAFSCRWRLRPEARCRHRRVLATLVR